MTYKFDALNSCDRADRRLEARLMPVKAQSPLFPQVTKGHIRSLLSWSRSIHPRSSHSRTEGAIRGPGVQVEWEEQCQRDCEVDEERLELLRANVNFAHSGQDLFSILMQYLQCEPKNLLSEPTSVSHVDWLAASEKGD